MIIPISKLKKVFLRTKQIFKQNQKESFDMNDYISSLYKFVKLSALLMFITLLRTYNYSHVSLCLMELKIEYEIRPGKLNHR